MAIATKVIPKIENHIAPFFSINDSKVLPNFTEKKATI
jgi:hypothetical protein